MDSIRAKPSSPLWARSTSPSRRPSSRVSSLSGRALSVWASVALALCGALDPIVASLARFACDGPDRLSSVAPSSASFAFTESKPAAKGRRRAVTSGMNEIAPSPAWQALVDHRRALAGRSLMSLFDADPTRFAQLSLTWDDWLADWSKQRLTTETMALLVAYARERNVPAWIAAMFAGEKINLSEQRPVLHTALRQQGDAPLAVDGADIIPAIRIAQARMRMLATQLRGG